MNWKLATIVVLLALQISPISTKKPSAIASMAKQAAFFVQAMSNNQMGDPTKSGLEKMMDKWHAASEKRKKWEKEQEEQ